MSLIVLTTLPPENIDKPEEYDRALLMYSQMNGPIPKQLTLLLNLQELYVFSIIFLCTHFNSFFLRHLNNNQLTGSIPSEIGALSNLKELYVKIILFPY